MKDAIAIFRPFKGATNFARFSLILLLAVWGGGSGTNSFAQTDTFVCTVDVPNAGDPIKNAYSGQPHHYYFSAVLQNNDEGAKRFLSWARRQFGSAWVKNPYSQSDGAVEDCIPFQGAGQDWLDMHDDGYDQVSNEFSTKTSWPNVLNP